MAQLPCEECQAWLYDIESGKCEPYLRGGQKQPRPPGSPTPCHICPKKSPEHAKELRLSTANWRTVKLFLRARATSGHLTMTEQRDSLLAKHFAVIDSILREYERSNAAERMTSGILTAILQARSNPSGQ